VKYIDLRIGIEHYRKHCSGKEGLSREQRLRAKSFEGSDYEERIKSMTEEE
jgi:hypothetical protein